jgi:hypothetical protein
VTVMTMRVGTLAVALVGFAIACFLFCIPVLLLTPTR